MPSFHDDEEDDDDADILQKIGNNCATFFQPFQMLSLTYSLLFYGARKFLFSSLNYCDKLFF